MATKTDAAKPHIVRINPYAEGFCAHKAPEPTADMVKDALDGFLSGNFEMVDSRALDYVGSRGQKVARSEPKITTFTDLQKAGVKFGSSSKPEIRTASYEHLRFVEALDRSVDASGRHMAEAPGLTYREKKVTYKKPQKVKPATPAFDNMHYFDGPRPKYELLMSGIQTFAKADHKR